MSNLLAVSVGAWVVIGIIAFIVVCVVMGLISRTIRAKYNHNIIWGGMILVVAMGVGVGGYFLSKSSETIGYALIGLGSVLIIARIIYDFKKCGGAGLVVWLIELLLCPASILLILQILTPSGRSNLLRDDTREERAARRMRERRGYYHDDNDSY